MLQKLREFAFDRFWDAPYDSAREAFWIIMHSFLCNPQREINDMWKTWMHKRIPF